MLRTTTHVFGVLHVITLAASLATTPAQARTTYYHNDALGSPVLATDEAGEPLWRAGYRPFGERDQSLADYANAAQNQRWYTGHPYDPSTGLVYMQARYYDPAAGRFLSPDPLPLRMAEPRSFNRYAYAWNNPFRYIDPDGRDSVVIGWKGAAAAGAGGALGAGVYVSYPLDDDTEWDIGIVASGAVVGGADVSSIGSITVLEGGRENLVGTSVATGTTVPATGIVGPAVDYEIIINKDTGELVGQSIGAGLAALPSLSVALTETLLIFSFRDWFERTFASDPDVVVLTEEELEAWYGFIGN